MDVVEIMIDKLYYSIILVDTAGKDVSTFSAVSTFSTFAKLVVAQNFEDILIAHHNP